MTTRDDIDDIVAALERAIEERKYQSDHVAGYLRALVDSLRKAETHYRSPNGHLYTEQRTSMSLPLRAPVWVIPEPRVKP